MKVQHYVLFHIAKGVKTNRVNTVKQLFLQCLGPCDGLEKVSWAENHSKSIYADGWTCGVFMQFRDAKSRDAYLVHPLHLDVSKETGSGFYTQLVVFDFDDPGENNGQ